MPIPVFSPAGRSAGGSPGRPRVNGSIVHGGTPLRSQGSCIKKRSGCPCRHTSTATQTHSPGERGTAHPSCTIGITYTVTREGTRARGGTRTPRNRASIGNLPKSETTESVRVLAPAQLPSGTHDSDPVRDCCVYFKQKRHAALKVVQRAESPSQLGKIVFSTTWENCADTVPAQSSAYMPPRLA